MLKIKFNLEAGQKLAVNGSNLSPRQSEVAAKVVEGMRNKQIAKEMSISPNTVKRHISSACNIVGCNDRHELVANIVREHYNLVTVSDQNCADEERVINSVSYDDLANKLTAKQQEVLAAAIKGGSYKSLANDLSLSANTVSKHLTQISKTLDLNRQQSIVVMGSLHHKERELNDGACDVQKLIRDIFAELDDRQKDNHGSCEQPIVSQGERDVSFN